MPARSQPQQRHFRSGSSFADNRCSAIAVRSGPWGMMSPVVNARPTSRDSSQTSRWMFRRTCANNRAGGKLAFGLPWDKLGLPVLLEDP